MERERDNAILREAGAQARQKLIAAKHGSIKENPQWRDGEFSKSVCTAGLRTSHVADRWERRIVKLHNSAACTLHCVVMTTFMAVLCAVCPLLSLYARRTLRLPGSKFFIRKADLVTRISPPLRRLDDQEIEILFHMNSPAGLSLQNENFYGIKFSYLSDNTLRLYIKATD